MKNKSILIILLVAAIVGVGLWYFSSKKIQEPEEIPLTLVNEVQYLCKNARSIEASYYEGELIPIEPGEMPTPSGEVRIILSDGRELTLPQTISASGVRYADEDDSIVFWSKGNGAFLLEDDVETYSECVILPEDPGGLPNVYLNDENGFLVRYPADYKVDTDYEYSALGPEKEIKGVKFIIPENFSEGTNLSNYDTGVSIEMIPIVENCDASLFLGEEVEIEEKDDNGMIYSFASITGAGAGNRYEEQVWAMPTIHNCVAIRYFIHSTSIENYPEGEVVEFDRDTLLDQFNKIRRYLVIQ